MSRSRYKLETAYGAIAVCDTGGSGQPLIMLHGSSASSDVFEQQMASPLADHFRLVAIDLPGHGRSGNFLHPDLTYILPNLTQTIAGLFPRLGIERAVVMGWSLGGHIAIEMMAKHPSHLAGVMVTGTPPLDTGPLATLRAFHFNPAILLVSRPELSPRDATRLAHMYYGDMATPALIEAIRRTDPHIRPRITRSLLRGDGANQRQVVETSPIPFAVVQGADDPAIRAGYLLGLNYANLWDGRVHLLDNGGHAPFMRLPNTFNALLHRFATEAGIGRPLPLDRSAARRA
ncbi:alpha/beta fold hydrolase [Pelagibacterium limicola]|uniref:alpha/beta fold hydrolase n=1 Tax=Pelagibacterium limicola TaxID=2791022 RepID=UPI0018AFD137|nr:alpha/beta hydrolase [Pelagibacterium limicola]